MNGLIARTKQAGFTLLEVMVALSICAVAGIAAMQATGEHINHISTLEQQAYASWVAENRLVMMRAGAKEGAVRNGLKGDEEMGGVTWYWSQSTLATADPTFVKVTIEVFSDEKREHSVYDLTTFIYKKGKR